MKNDFTKVPVNKTCINIYFQLNKTVSYLGLDIFISAFFFTSGLIIYDIYGVPHDKCKKNVVGFLVRSLGSQVC